MSVEWSPSVPRCCRCGERRWATGYVKMDEGYSWSCDLCLTDRERAAHCREEPKPRGKVHIPTEGK